MALILPLIWSVTKSALRESNTFSLGNLVRRIWTKRFSLDFKLCEPTVPQVEHLLASIIKTYYKLQELGFTYHNGKITVVEVEEAENVT